MGWLRRNGAPVSALVFTVLGIVVIAGSVDSWISDQAAYDAFRSSPACAEGPVQAGADCVARQPSRVLGVQSHRGDTDVSVQGRPDFEYDDDQGFASSLRAGEIVEVIVWRGAVQGLETASDGPDYLSTSAVRAPTLDYIATMLGAGLLCLGGLFAVDTVLRRRGASPGRIRTMRWSFGAAAGLVILNAVGVIVAGLIPGGFVLDGVAGAIGLFVIGLMWAYGGGARYPRGPMPVRPADVPTGSSADARKRRRARSRPRRRRGSASR